MPSGGGGILVLSSASSASATNPSESTTTKLSAKLATAISINAPEICALSEPNKAIGATIAPTEDGTLATCRTVIQDESGNDQTIEGENVVVSTNNTTGYQLYMSMQPDSTYPQNSDLHHTTDSSKKISNASTSTTLDNIVAGTWAYNTPGLDEEHPNTNYGPLPTIHTSTTSGHLIRQSDIPQNKHITNVKFATKIDFKQASGEYTNKVLYTAVTNEVPTPTITSISPDWLPVGNSDTHQVTLQGTLLDQAGSIRIGDANCTNIKVSSDKKSLTCEVGPSATMEQDTNTFYKAGMDTNDPTMQKMTANIANTTSSPVDRTVDITVNDDIVALQPTIHYYQEATLRDTRGDGQNHEQTYTVAKLKDINGQAQVWMTENLNLFLTNGNPLDNTNTNLNGSVTSWNPPVNTYTDISQWGDGEQNAPRSYDPGEEYYYTSGTTNPDIQYTSLAACTNAGHSAGDCKHYSTGLYYNYNATIAADTYSAPQYTNAPNSICPKGWRLPSVGDTTNPSEFGTMLYAQGLTDSDGGTSGDVIRVNYTTSGFNNLRTAPLYWVRTGRINSNSRYGAGGNGYYWSSTINGVNNVYSTNFYNSYLSPRDNINRSHGRSLRCIARTDNVNPPTPDPTPTPTPSDDGSDSVAGGGALSAGSYGATGSSSTGGVDSNAYSSPQGAYDTSLKHFAENGGPNWFLFILLLILAVLTLGISLFIFWRKNKQEKQAETEAN